ncbi:MAG: phenylalanine--tRNA ligase subunit alpha [Minwuia sp.]|nr:phenylalanine--tRNA ligase subunit alpha [Minwuia sp.]
MDIESLEAELTGQISGAANLVDLEAARVATLGKKSRLSEVMRGLGKMDPVERQTVAPRLNALKNTLNQAIDDRRSALKREELESRLSAEQIDITLTSRPEIEGRIHPVSQVVDEITEIFADMGFAIAEGPDIEDDFHNFTALNFPPAHPARDMHDTFFFDPKADGERMLLRTHTSSVQIRTMETQDPPHRIVIPGRTYRSDSDMTHTPMFHQIEGLVIDRNLHMGHLKGTLEAFSRAFFELDEVRMRFRPSYFPFTEPSAEVDIGCSFDKGQIRIGEGTDWLEILGCGMVHPNVLRACGLDPEEWQGFAWGMGIDRIAMLKYGIPDLRAFFESDVRWLRHYGFQPTDVPSLGGGLSR